MKRILVFFLPLMLVINSCGLLSKKGKGVQDSDNVKTWFAQSDFEEFRQSLMITYSVTNAAETYDFAVYPFSNDGYSYDYLINGSSGTVFSSAWAKESAVKYNTVFYGDTLRLDSMGSVWLSNKTFNDLYLNGKSKLYLSGIGEQDFYVKGTETVTLGIQDSSITISAVVLKNLAGDKKIVFLPDSKYPLILSMDIGFQVQIMRIDNAEAGFDDYQIGPGSVLMYQLIEGGMNNYTVTLSNQFWSDTIQKWQVTGNYSGSYEYSFDFLVSYEGDAIISPEFLIPMFTANKDEYSEKKTNWFIMNKKDVNALVANKIGYLDIPHFAYNPDDMDTTDYDPDDLERDRNAYKESYHTKFELMYRGRMLKSTYVYTDKDSYEDKQIPSMFLYALNENLVVEINNEGLSPFLLYYTDGTMWEVKLVHAGFPVGE